VRARSPRSSTPHSPTRPASTPCRDFFEGVGEGHAAGVWDDTPHDRPEFRKKYAGMLAAKAKAEEAVGT